MATHRDNCAPFPFFARPYRQAPHVVLCPRLCGAVRNIEFSAAACTSCPHRTARPAKVRSRVWTAASRIFPSREEINQNDAQWFKVKAPPIRNERNNQRLVDDNNNRSGSYKALTPGERKVIEFILLRLVSVLHFPGHHFLLSVWSFASGPQLCRRGPHAMRSYVKGSCDAPLTTCNGLCVDRYR